MVPLTSSVPIMRCTINSLVYWAVEDDYVAVWIVSVQVFGVYALDDYDVAYTQGSVKRVG